MLAVIVASLTVNAGGASAAPLANEGNHCISPTGVDLNERYALSIQIVAPFCPEIGSGQQWTTVALWVMGTSFETVPEGFVAAGATPLEDFLARFVGATFVVDPGTAQERAYPFANDGNLWTGNLDGLDAVNTVTLGALHPLPVGEHVVVVSWTLSGLHRDGLGDVPAENCLPAGEFVFSEATFEVTLGHA
jgi:hypothetical protein